MAARHFLATFALVVLAAVCTPDDRARTPATAAAPSEVTLTATDYAFDSEDTIAAGWTTFRLVNRGAVPHMGQLIRLEPGRTVEEFLAAYGEAFRTEGPRPEWTRRLGGPGVAAPQRTTKATVRLEPGRYVWICLFNLPDGIPHVVGHGMARPFDVVASRTDAGREPPRADIVMRLVDYAFDLSAPLRAGRQVIRVENPGSESHEVAVVKLLPGRTVEDVHVWLQNPAEASPLELEGAGGGITSLAPGAEAYFELDLAPGDYALLCFVTARDGRSHIDHGMIRQIRVG